MDTPLFPTRPGQICKIISNIPDKESDQVYIVAENPLDFNDDDEILVVDLKELQRNVKNPDHAERISVRKDELVVVGEDLESYIKSWNVK
ncbi:MAG TPA: hypothetical protein VK616_19690 [Flavitalea sp.]|nr:hypothetical protein [Flavitalea sp.]